MWCSSLASATAFSPLFIPLTSIRGGLYGYCTVIQYDVLPATGLFPLLYIKVGTLSIMTLTLPWRLVLFLFFVLLRFFPLAMWYYLLLLVCVLDLIAVGVATLALALVL